MQCIINITLTHVSANKIKLKEKGVKVIYHSHTLQSKNIKEKIEYNKNQVILRNEPRHEIYNNVVCATNKASDQPAHTCSLIRAFASRMNIL